MIKIKIKYMANMIILDITYDNNSSGIIIAVVLRNNSGCKSLEALQCCGVFLVGINICLKSVF